ncbi:glycosyltransferase [Ammoniphilus sp. CFH 90114]|uniref:glycosyltransferase n=1 Tax=Ammoniphilus sp. CFH 90114 TaxID=2493665 RepID=UPI00100E13BC|nr:glycosyltransferase [Ammoniphilus sp. CFH 90114]RXT13972.1 colanic acid biosynthesis glycosyltransferase WcaL [Ammoniphilus sp. CFH 90114]
MRNRKPIVVYRERYLPLSETFIYEQIKHLEEYQPYVLCKEILPEAKNFPYKRVYCLQNIRNKAVVLRRQGIRLIYARFGMGGVEMLPLKRAARLPMLTSFHGSDVSRQLNKRPDYRESLPALFSEGERFTVVCEYMKKKLIDLGCSPQKITVIKSGIDLSKFEFRPKFNADPKVIRILSVGRLTEKKGMDDLVIAFSRVVLSYPKARLTIIGDGEERERLESLIWSLGIERNVELLGRQSHEIVQEEMQRCDIFALASRTAADGNEEGIPNVLMEAMASGRLVVATQHAGIPELVKQAKTGLLAKENTPKELGTALLRAIEKQEDWQQLITNAREIVVNNHDVLKQVKTLENVMDEVVFQFRRSIIARQKRRTGRIQKRRG